MTRIAGSMLGVAVWLGAAGLAAAQHDHAAMMDMADPPAAQERPAPDLKVQQPRAPVKTSPLTVHTRLSQTAIWVGDHVVYTVEIVCPPGVDILTDDLGRDRLRLDGLELLDATLEREAHADGSVLHRAQYQLASYATGTDTVHVNALPVRYHLRRAGDRAENLRAAEEIEVAAADIPLRSTLPAVAPAGIRDTRALRTLPPAIGLLRPLGIGAIILSLVPVVFGVIAAVLRLRRPTRSPRSRRRHRREHQEALDRVRQLAERADPASRQEAYDALGLLLREHLSETGAPAEAMTADEVERHLAGRGAATVGVASLVRECDRARYGDPAQVPDRETLQQALEQVRDLIERRAR